MKRLIAALFCLALWLSLITGSFAAVPKGGGGGGGNNPPKPQPAPAQVGPPDYKTICQGEGYYYTLNVRAGGANTLTHVNVVSSNPSVATANYDIPSQTVSGMGMSPGTATIGVSGAVQTQNQNIPFSQSITVTVLTCFSVEICKGGSSTVPMDKAENATSSNTSVATAGAVKMGVIIGGVDVGSAVVSVTDASGKTVGRITVTVKKCPRLEIPVYRGPKKPPQPPPPPPPGGGVLPSSISLCVGESQKFELGVQNSISATSANPGVAATASYTFQPRGVGWKTGVVWISGVSLGSTVVTVTDASTNAVIGQINVLVKYCRADISVPVVPPPHSPPRPDVPLRDLLTDPLVSVSLTGEGKAAGEVFTLSIRNDTAHPVTVSIPGGTVVVPADPGHQRMIVEKSVYATIAPHSSAEAPVYGYCLDHEKLPPPRSSAPLVPGNIESVAADKSDHVRTWSIPEDQTPFRPMADIVKAGNDLAEQGKFTSGLQDAERYKIGIIERALWYYNSKDTDKPIGKDFLSQDIDKQLAAMPAEKRPSKEEKEKVVNSIWNDVNLTLKTAAASR